MVDEMSSRSEREAVVDSRQVFDGKLLKVRVDTVLLPGGGTAIREVVLHPGAAAVVAIDERGKVFLVEQYRHAAGRALLEIPAGKIEPGEDPMACAVRELSEEAGLEAASWEVLGRFYTTPGFSNEVIYVYLARGLARVEARPEADERFRLVEIPLRETLAMVGTGHITDAKTIAGLFMAAERVGRDGLGQA